MSRLWSDDVLHRHRYRAAQAPGTRVDGVGQLRLSTCRVRQCAAPQTTPPISSIENHGKVQDEQSKLGRGGRVDTTRPRPSRQAATTRDARWMRASRLTVGDRGSGAMVSAGRVERGLQINASRPAGPGAAPGVLRAGLGHVGSLAVQGAPPTYRPQESRGGTKRRKARASAGEKKKTFRA
jgi:hypothetical protein